MFYERIAKHVFFQLKQPLLINCEVQQKVFI